MTAKRRRRRVGYYPEQQGQSAISHSVSSVSSGTKRRRIKPKVIFRFSIFILCVAIFVFCAVKLVSYIVQSIRSVQANKEFAVEVYETLPTQTPEAVEEINEVQPTDQVEEIEETVESLPEAGIVSEQADDLLSLWPTQYSGNKTLRVSAKWDGQLSKNSDFIGLLSIDEVLDAPVFQRDNSYYLTHDALQRESQAGALFLDEGADLKTVPTQYVIHGHNMKDGVNFGALKKYKVKDVSFFQSHPYITFNTIYEDGKYVIFAVCEVDIRAGTANFLPFWAYSRFSSEDAFSQYVAKIKALSHYDTAIEVVPGDRLLTLATCNGNDDNSRLLVVARKIRPGESEFDLNLSILSTGNK